MIRNGSLAEKIVQAVIAAGGTPYLVGGYVRDALDAKVTSFCEQKEVPVPQNADIDFVVTGISADNLSKCLPGNVSYVGKSFGVFKVSNPEDPHDIVDVALPRKEFKVGPKHTDFEIQSDPNMSVADDASRRDFTCNAIHMHATTFKIGDPFRGVHDIMHQVIRTVGKASDRFTEDPLRLMRAYRFAAQLGYTVHPDIIAYAKANPNSMKSVSAERLGIEFSKLLMGKNSKTVMYALKTMARTGDLFFLFPELKASYGFKQNNSHHYLTVLEHVFMALRYSINHNATLATRYALLFHDISKPATYTVDELGRGHFYKHDEVGANKAYEYIMALALPQDLAISVKKMVFNHLNPYIDCTKRTIRRFLATMGDLSDQALLVRKSDGAAHANGRTYVQNFDKVEEMAKNSQEIRGFSEADLALNGHEIATMFGIKGKEIGILKKAATEAVIAGEVANDRVLLITWASEYVAFKALAPKGL